MFLELLQVHRKHPSLIITQQVRIYNYITKKGKYIALDEYFFKVHVFELE